MIELAIYQQIHGLHVDSRINFALYQESLTACIG